MKTPSILLTVFSLLLTGILFSCKKEENTNANNTTDQAGFYYAENGSSSQTKAENAYANKQYKTIIAQMQSKTVVEIVLDNLQTGTYSLAKKYAFTYVKEGSYWESSAGTLTITKNDGAKVSGTFEATAGTGVTGVNNISGKFIDIPIN